MLYKRIAPFCVLAAFLAGCSSDPQTVIGWPGYVSVTPSSATLMVGDTFRIVASSSNAKYSQIRFQSTDSSVAQIDSLSGFVRAVKSGVATLVATAHDPSSTSTASDLAGASIIKVNPATVNDCMPGISLVPSITLPVGGNTTVTAVALCGTQLVTWSSSAPSIASVDSLGVVRGITPGKASIMAREVADTSRTATAGVTILASGVRHAVR